MRLIDAETLIEELNTAKENFVVGENAERIVAASGKDIISAVNEFFVETIEAAKTVIAAPVVHGEWIESRDDNFLYESIWRCSECKEEFVGYGIPFQYCPNCGAQMD